MDDGQGARGIPYGSGFLFFLFFYSFAEYVDIDFLNYIIAPGSFMEQRGNDGTDAVSSVLSEETVCCLTVVPLFNNISPFFPVL